MGLSIFRRIACVTGQRRVGAVTSGRGSGKQGGTAEIYFLSLLPQGSEAFFIGGKTHEANGETMAPLTKEAVPIPSLY